MKLIRKLRRFLRFKSVTYHAPFRQLTNAGLGSLLGIWGFYLLNAYSFFREPLLKEVLAQRERVLWPAEIFSWLGLMHWPWFVCAFLAFGLMAPLFFPWRKWAQFLAFFSSLSALGFLEDPDSIGHSIYLFVFTSFWLFVFLPHRGIRSRREFLWACLSSLAMARIHWCAVYFCAGSWKLWTLLSGDPNHRDWVPWSEKLSYIATQPVVEYGGRGALAPLLIDNPVLNIAGLFGVVLFQLGAVFAVIQPKWTTAVGICAILFHISSGLFMDVHFGSTIFALLLIFVLPSAHSLNKLPKSFHRT